jgi:hypothetical protein
MGLTEDESKVIFHNNDDTATQLTLYNDQDDQAIDFIENKANLYQLSQLHQIYKQLKDYKSDEDITTFIEAIRDCILKCQSL